MDVPSQSSKSQIMKHFTLLDASPLSARERSPQRRRPAVQCSCPTLCPCHCPWSGESRRGWSCLLPLPCENSAPPHVDPCLPPSVD